MNGTDLPQQAWFKSSYSNGQAACVEIARLEAGVATRDSKEPAGPVLTFTAEAWDAFLGSVRNGEFGRP